MIKNIYLKLKPSNKRSELIFNNIIASFILKGISISLSLLIIPLTIDFVNPEQYGIWLTISSMITWIAYFDIGFDQGLRYRFAEAKAIGDDSLAKKYISTTYIILILLFSFVSIIFLLVNNYINWTKFLNIEKSVEPSINTIFHYIIIFFCIQMTLKPVSTILIANQRPALSSLILTSGQVLSLITIMIFSENKKGNLLDLAIIFTGIPCLVYFISTFILFSNSEYRKFSPSFRYIDFSLSKLLLGKGFQYFFTVISTFLIFQLFNIIILRELGPENVTQYNIAYKYYYTIIMCFIIVSNPLWSAFTEAYVKKDFNWMENIVKKYVKIAFIFILIGLLMLIFSNQIFRLWFGDKVEVSFALNLFVFIQCVIQIFPAIYVYPINGIGSMRIQTYVYVFFSIFAVPSLILLCRTFGISGMSFYVIIVYITLGFFCRLQFKKLMKGTATGIWSK